MLGQTASLAKILTTVCFHECR